MIFCIHALFFYVYQDRICYYKIQCRKRAEEPSMNIAFVIYEGMTALDFIGLYDPVVRLKTMGFMPDLRWDICAHTPEVRDGTGLLFTPTKVGTSLQDYDMVLVPGGFSTREIIDDP